MKNKEIIDVKNLEISFKTEKGILKAVDDVSFSIQKGELVGLVGESGCGKSVTAESILRLHNPLTTKYEGEINFKNVNLSKLTKKELRKIRGNEISMIFQDPMSSLNPVFIIGDQIMEVITIHQKVNKARAREIAIEMLKLTGIPSPEKRINEYPHELSGGMRQRVMIALALSCKPSLLIADEPTTALDVTIQAQILELINSLRRELEMSVLMITHDLSVVAETCSRVIVMYLGQIIEEANVPDLFNSPRHPYTKGLLKSVPDIEGNRTEKLHVIKGMVPSLDNKPTGCRFAPRCDFATDICHKKVPLLEEIKENGHRVRCWHHKELIGVEENAEIYK